MLGSARLILAAWVVSVGALPEGLSLRMLNEMKGSFLRLDRDGDGIVRTLEAAAGLLSLAETDNFVEEDILTSVTKGFSSRTKMLTLGSACGRPQLEPTYFADCVSAKALRAVHGDQRNKPIAFQEALKEYFNGCKDTFPSDRDFHLMLGSAVSSTANSTPNNVTNCQDLLNDDYGRSIYGRNICLELNQLNREPLCELSCRMCGVSKIQRSDIATTSPTGGPGAYSSAQMKNAVNDSLRILIASDWHVEPWYCSDPSRRDCDKHIVDPRVARFVDANLDNMFTCRGGSGQCSLQGTADPPLDLIGSGFENFQTSGNCDTGGNLFSSFLHYAQGSRSRDGNSSSHASSILLFPGDTQAHDFEPSPGSSWNASMAISRLMNTSLALMLAAFDGDPDRIFVCPGNNDGPHSAIFVQGGKDAETKAWADALVSAGIITDALPRKYTSAGLSPTNFFRRTGYFLKQVKTAHKGESRSNIYVMSLNTNLGKANAAQVGAMLDDLEWLLKGGASGDPSNGSQLFVMGHHPDTMLSIAGDPNLLGMLSKGPYSGMVRSVLAGHVHFASNTEKDTLFTQVPAMTEAALTTGFYVKDVHLGSAFLDIDINNDLVSRASRPDNVADCHQWLPGLHNKSQVN